MFAILYIMLFRETPCNPVLLGTLFGVVQWLLVGGMFVFAPLVYAGMKAGMVKEPGAYMMESLGIMGFIGGLVGHSVFGLTVAFAYGWFA